MICTLRMAFDPSLVGAAADIGDACLRPCRQDFILQLAVEDAKPRHPAVWCWLSKHARSHLQLAHAVRQVIEQPSHDLLAKRGWQQVVVAGQPIDGVLWVPCEELISTLAGEH